MIPVVRAQDFSLLGSFSLSCSKIIILIALYLLRLQLPENISGHEYRKGTVHEGKKKQTKGH